MFWGNLNFSYCCFFFRACSLVHKKKGLFFGVLKDGNLLSAKLIELKKVYPDLQFVTIMKFDGDDSSLDSFETIFLAKLSKIERPFKNSALQVTLFYGISDKTLNLHLDREMYFGAYMCEFCPPAEIERLNKKN